MEEIWKILDGFDGKYQVSNLGNFRGFLKKGGGNRWGNSKSKLSAVKIYIDPKGYCRVTLNYKGKKLGSKFLHILVATAFLGRKPFPEAQVNHKDCNKTNNCVINLEWVTPRQNTHHAIIHQNHNWGTLSKNEVLDIRVQVNELVSQLSSKYEVDRGTIKNISMGNTWKWL